MSLNIESYIKNEQAALNQVSSKLPANQKVALNSALSAIKTQQKPPKKAMAEKPAYTLPAGQAGVLDGRLPIGGTLLQLGDFQFASGRANLDSLARTTEYRWSQQDRLGRQPTQQWVGEGSDSITLSGLVVGAYQQDYDSLSVLREMASKGEPYRLVSGFGTIYGLWVIKSIEHTATELDNNGRAGWVEFSLKLSSYGEDEL